MRYLALCCDYDGTIAHHGVVDAPTLAALERVVASGRRLVLVTGRELDDLQRVMPRLDLFERVVAENGALLYTPATREVQPLAEAPAAALVTLLRERGVQPLSVGRCIVATWDPHSATVLSAIRELGLELQVVFNKGAVMVLPSGVNKASGLVAALASLGLSPHDAVGVGDAENDHALLRLCECAAAVANALPSLKDEADIVTAADHGAGVAQLIDDLLADDLARYAPRLARHRLPLAAGDDGSTLALDPYATVLLIAGTSGSGKSTVAKALLERLGERGYSFAVIDPEGDYERLPGAVTLGSADRAPSADEVLLSLEGGANVVVHLTGLPLAERPGFLLALLPRLTTLRARSARPHWLIVDEAHHLMPAGSQSVPHALPQRLHATVLITVHPDKVAPRALQDVDAAVVVGSEPHAQLRQLAAAGGQAIDVPAGDAPLPPGEALVWLRGSVPRRARPLASRLEHRRHQRKYAEGELPPDRCFYFRGADGKLNLKAQNLIAFLQLADGIDDETWRFHLRRGDYSRWFENGIKDQALADEARRVEAMSELPPSQSRALMRRTVERVYTLPA